MNFSISNSRKKRMTQIKIENNTSRQRLDVPNSIIANAQQQN